MSKEEFDELIGKLYGEEHLREHKTLVADPRVLALSMEPAPTARPAAAPSPNKVRAPSLLLPASFPPLAHLA